MKHKINKSVIITIGVIMISTFSSNSQDNKWISLLDKNLTQWEMYLSYKLTDNYNGQQPINDKGEIIQPVGYNKNADNVFTVSEENGEPVLRISGEIYGCVFTKKEFENYHLKLKVKWGEKKWEPRKLKLKDSGLLYHSIGECGIDYWRSWMLGQEFQVMEGHMGDYWSIANSAIDIRAYLPEGIMNPVANTKQAFLPLGAGTGLDGFCLREENNESAPGKWTELELVCFDGKSLHIVNGHVVMVLQNSRFIENGQPVKLTKGKIQLQSEAAEVFYKDIKIRNLTSLPKEFVSYFQ